MRRTLLVLAPIAQSTTFVVRAAHCLQRVPKWLRFALTVFTLLTVELAATAAAAQVSCCRNIHHPPDWPYPGGNTCMYYDCYTSEGCDRAYWEIYTWGPGYSCPTLDTCYDNQSQGCGAGQACGSCTGIPNDVCHAPPSCRPAIPGAISGAPPSGLSLTGIYTLSWTAPNGVVNQYATATSYKLYKNPGNIEIYSGPGLSFQVRETTDGVYRYKVEGCNSFACGDFTAEVTVTVNLPPGQPGPIAGPSYRGPSYTISWGTASGTVQNYKLQESGAANNLYDNGTSTSKLFSGRPYGTYYYQVQACNNGTNCGPWTSSATIVVSSFLTGAPDDALLGPTVPAQQYVGTVPGAPSVEGGAASYHIPIEVPPGRAGMQPELSLN